MNSREAVSILGEGDLAPDFELAADDGATIRLSELRGRKVVLYFYPKANTPDCTTESCEFGNRNADFEKARAAILGISPDSVKKVRSFRQKFDLPFRLLADPDHRVAEMYGVWQEKSMYGRVYWGVARTTFVIDEDEIIERTYRKVRPEGHAQAVLLDL